MVALRASSAASDARAGSGQNRVHKTPTRVKPAIATMNGVAKIDHRVQRARNSKTLHWLLRRWKTPVKRLATPLLKQQGKAAASGAAGVGAANAASIIAKVATAK